MNNLLIENDLTNEIAVYKVPSNKFFSTVNVLNPSHGRKKILNIKTIKKPIMILVTDSNKLLDIVWLINFPHYPNLCLLYYLFHYLRA